MDVDPGSCHIFPEAHTYRTALKLCDKLLDTILDTENFGVSALNYYKNQPVTLSDGAVTKRLYRLKPVVCCLLFADFLFSILNCPEKALLCRAFLFALYLRTEPAYICAP